MLFQRKKKLGIAFSGGGVRGYAHLGAWQCLIDNKIQMADMVAGTSIGSFIGSCYCLGMEPGQVYEYVCGPGTDEFGNYTFSKGEFFDSIKEVFSRPSKVFALQKDSSSLEGLALGLYGDKQFSDMRIPFAAIATDLACGQEAQLRDGSLAFACRASAAVPGFFTPAEKDGMILVDGCLTNNLPADLLKAEGMDVVLGITLEFDSFKPAHSTKLTDVMGASWQVASRHAYTKNYKYCDVLVCPPLEKYAKMKFSMDKMKIEEIYDAGYEAMDAKIHELKELLGPSKKLWSLKN
ncbi:MAG: patatin-like phospholipase family protein [Eubacteriaceae bacterium]|nr:patatin-like phospholipase family protein [Eubacteriaceae bacterium]